MALTLKKVESNGITTTYHRISRLEVKSKIVVIISSYIDESYRELEKQNEMEILIRETSTVEELIEQGRDNLVVEQKYSISESVYAFALDKEESISFINLYESIKALPEFTGAIDN